MCHSNTYCRGSYLGCVKRIWYLLPMRPAKVQASLRIRAVSPEPPLLAHKSSESRGTFRQKARSLAPLNGWACAVKICHDGMLEDTNSLGAAHFSFKSIISSLEVLQSQIAAFTLGRAAITDRSVHIRKSCNHRSQRSH